MHVQKVPCPKCYAPTERLRGAMGMQDRRCSACKYEGRGRWQFVWDNHEAPMSRKELDRLNEKPKSWDQLYDEQLARWQPTIKKYKTAVVPSREEWIAKQTQEEATSQGMLVAQERAGSSWDPEKYNAPETLARWKAYTGPLRASGYTAWFNAGCPESPPEDISGGIS